MCRFSVLLKSYEYEVVVILYLVHAGPPILIDCTFDAEIDAVVTLVVGHGYISLSPAFLSLSVPVRLTYLDMYLVSCHSVLNVRYVKAVSAAGKNRRYR